MSYLTPSEVEWLQTQRLSLETPFMICDVKSSFFSIARYSGTCKYNKALYTYLEATDELIRDDVLQSVNRKRKADSKARVQAELDRTGSLFGDE